MADLATIGTILVGVVAAVAAIVGLLIARKHPNLDFRLMHAILPVSSGGQITEVSMLIVRMDNKKRTFGDSARDVRTNILYPGTIEGDQQLHKIRSPLPWIRNYPTEVPVNGAPEADDYPSILENNVFDRTPRMIPQGQDSIAIVSYSIKKYKRIYHATNPPAPLRIPPHERIMPMNPFQLEISGSNVPSTTSDPTMMMVTIAGDWTVPESVKELAGPHVFRNLLLSVGILKREQRIIPWAQPGQVRLRELKLVVRR